MKRKLVMVFSTLLMVLILLVMSAGIAHAGGGGPTPTIPCNIEIVPADLGIYVPADGIINAIYNSGGVIIPYGK